MQSVSPQPESHVTFLELYRVGHLKKCRVELLSAEERTFQMTNATLPPTPPDSLIVASW